MRLFYVLACMLLLNNSFVMAQLAGKVVSSIDGKAIVGATIQSIESRSKTVTDSKGHFYLAEINVPNSLTVSAMGYELLVLVVHSLDDKEISLIPVTQVLEEVVVNTGYQSLPKERATGSFVSVDKYLLDRGIGYNVIQRLDGVVSGLHFDMAGSSGEPTNRTNIRIRGLSTINGETQPLIVVDNFPYEGNIENINPNDIEDITILKDAAAASIWGARAGNGVIVITTKKGKVQEPRIEVVTNVGLGSKPNLFYDPRYIPSKDLIELEVELFKKGIYKKNDWTEFSPVVDLLFSENDPNIINSKLESWKDYDIRKDAGKYLYRQSYNQQFAFSIRGGAEKNTYSISAGYDLQNGVLKGNSENRFTFDVKNSVKLLRGVELQNSINIMRQASKKNGFGLNAIAPETWSRMYTYGSLVEADGAHSAIPKVIRYGYAQQAEDGGLLDWMYRPLDELALKDNTDSRREIRINTGVIYEILTGLKLEGRYQYQLITSEARELFTEDSFYARNIINRFTQPDFSKPIPVGAILDQNHGNFYSHYGRIQSTYAKKWNQYHDVNILGGMEIRQERDIGSGSKRLYGYNDALRTSYPSIDYNKVYTLRPTSSGTIPSFTNAGNHITDRFVSYYGNLGYSYKSKYLLSGSIRWDASNIFGVDFNRKGVPLWSTGLSWKVYEEDFFKIHWINLFKLRATYGANGNVVRSQSALPYINYGVNNVVSRSLVAARLSSIGNPSLSWEKVSAINLGLDFAVLKSRISGSIEWYNKKSSNLIGKDYLDPTTGIIPVLTYFNIANDKNYADMTTNGIDVDLTTYNTVGKLKWRSNMLFSYTSNKVTNYYATENLPITSYLTYGNPTVRENVSRDQIYSIPWYGLNEEGDPLVSNGGVLDTDYVKYFNELNYEDLLTTGVSVAPYFGSFRNTFDWNNLSFSFNITWRAGHKYRRESIAYDTFFRTGISVHEDYMLRWQKPGDEELTHVPAMPEGTNAYRGQAYTFSEALIENASSVRLKDIQLSYTLQSSLLTSKGIRSVRINTYAKNLGVIWKAGSSRLDPDARGIYPQPFQLNIGVQANF